MGSILVPYGSHMDVPRWVPDESLLQNPHQSHMGFPYRTHIITHLGPIFFACWDGSYMGNPYGTDVGFATGIHLGPIWAHPYWNHMGPI